MNTKINFLIVEDSLSFGLELKMIVEEIGYRVIGRVENSAKALEIIFSKKARHHSDGHQHKWRNVWNRNSQTHSNI